MAATGENPRNDKKAHLFIGIDHRLRSNKCPSRPEDLLLVSLLAHLFTATAMCGESYVL